MPSHISCVVKGREHQWFSALANGFNPAEVTSTDWCIRCGEFADARPHIVIKGQRREVEDIEPPGELL
jgi:hypothetical protein